MRAHPAGPRHGDVIAAHTPPAPPRSGTAELDRAVWPRTAKRGPVGELIVGGCDVRDLAQRFETPLFILDEADFRHRAAEFRASYSGEPTRTPATVYYAAKAFLATAVAHWVEEEGLGLDVASGGELAVALAAGFPGERMILHGNNKSLQEIARALESGVDLIVIDSLQEIDRVAEAAAQCGVVANVLVRVTVGVEAHTHEFIATAHEDQKFGLPIDQVLEAVRLIRDLPALRFRGLHSHIGSQIFDASGFEIAASRVVDLAAELAESGVSVEVLDLGGGMGIAYVSSDDPIDVPDMAAAIDRIVVKSCERAGVPLPRLAFEPGRAIVGPSGITIYEVGTIKSVPLDQGVVRTYVSVDGGMSDNIRTALYDADYTVVLASRESSAEPMLCRVVGKHCESGDIVVRDAWLPGDLRPGDLLAVAATGAYCRSMASQYNYVPRPAVVSVRDGEPRVVLRRESEQDLLALDPGVTV